MSDSVKTFERFRQEHARLHDPLLVRGAVEFVPVELSEVRPGAVLVWKKGKKRHGQRAGRAATGVAAPPAAEPPEEERLLPSGLMAEPRARGKLAQDKTAREGGPRIEVAPRSVARSLSLFQEQTFALDAPAARQVELVWREEQALAGREDATPLDGAESGPAQSSASWRGELQRAVMDHRQADRFEAQIGIGDGAYLFAFAVNGHMRPEARLARRVLLTRDGLFAPLALTRHEQTLMLTNNGGEDERVRLEESVPWLVASEPQIDLPARSSVVTKVRFHPPAMLPGSNEGLLRLSVEREGGAAAAGVVHFAAEVEVGGAVPEISLAPREFGEVRQGLDSPQLRVEVTARGRGPLTGMVSLPHSGDLADFHLSAGDGDAAHFAHTFHVASAGLPQPQMHHTEAALKVLLITDSFLANYRLCRAEIPYRPIFLRKSLPALSFGTVRAGGSKRLRLEVERSDRREIELTVALPAGAGAYLEAYPARADAYVFRLDANALPPGTSISETIELIDRKSGLRDHIKVIATVAGGADGTARAVATSATS